MSNFYHSNSRYFTGIFWVIMYLSIFLTVFGSSSLSSEHLSQDFHEPQNQSQPPGKANEYKQNDLRINPHNDPAFLSTYLSYKSFLPSPSYRTDHLRKSLQFHPISLISDDFDEDGVKDLVVGGKEGFDSNMLIFYRGNIDCLYPYSPDAKNRNNVHTGDPFLLTDTIVETDISPDFMGNGDFNADGHTDIVFASRTDDRLCWLFGKGDFAFHKPEWTIDRGPVTAMITKDVNRRDGLNDVICASTRDNSTLISVYEGPDGARNSKPEVFSAPYGIKQIEIGRVDSDCFPDIVTVGSQEINIIYGRDRKLSLSSTRSDNIIAAKREQLIFPLTITSIAVSDFIPDNINRNEIIALTEYGSFYFIEYSPHAQLLQYQESDFSLQRDSLRDDIFKLTPTSFNSIAITSDQENLFSFIHPNFNNADRARITDISSQIIETPGSILLPLRLNSDAIDDFVFFKKGECTPSYIMSSSKSTFLVTNTDDSGLGSLRQAILDSNSNPAPDNIHFDIPGNSPFVIVPLSALPSISDNVTIDGTTQPGYDGIPLIVLDGSQAGVDAIGLDINAGYSTIRGLAINQFDNHGIMITAYGHNIIEGNFIGTDPTGTVDQGNGEYGCIIYKNNNTVGGTVPSARNVISGNDQRGVCFAYSTATDNELIGNFIGTDVSGQAFLGNSLSGVIIYETGSNMIGGTDPGDSNLISGNNSYGIHIWEIGSTANLIQGNLIGTNVYSDLRLGNNRHGVIVEDASYNTIGGTTPVARNIISGNYSEGVKFNESIPGSANCQHNIIQGNFIGTDGTGFLSVKNSSFGVAIGKASFNDIGGSTISARNIISGNGNGVGVYFGGASNTTICGNYIGVAVDGITPLGNLNDGISLSLDTGDNVQIGGHNSAEGNIIANNVGDGIEIESGNSHLIRGNLIYNNGHLGIDLNDDDVTLNDINDVDTGPNDLQNFPVISLAAPAYCSTNIEGTLNSIANSTFILDFFHNYQCHSSGFGQGETYLGEMIVTTDASGNVTFNTSFPVALNSGEFLTVTATDQNDNTSEFSECFEINPGSIPAEVSGLTWCVDQKDCLTWEEELISSEYNLYRGIPEDLPNLLDGTVDSCLWDSFVSNTSGNTILEQPNPGSFYWYIVTGVNICGEGYPGETSTQRRILDSSGNCF